MINSISNNLSLVGKMTGGKIQSEQETVKDKNVFDIKTFKSKSFNISMT